MEYPEHRGMWNGFIMQTRKILEDIVRDALTMIRIVSIAGNSTVCASVRHIVRFIGKKERIPL